MENLIRAKNGQMFVHVDLTAMNALVTGKIAGSVQGGQSLKRTGLLSEVTRPFTFSIAPELSDSLTINTAPILGAPQVYMQYIRFLSLRNPTERLQEVKVKTLDLNQPTRALVMLSPGKHVKPGDYVPGTLTKWDGRQYYIPSAYRQAYFDLCLGLLNRQTEAAPPKATGMGVLETQAEHTRRQFEETQEQLKRTQDKVDELRALELQSR